VFRFEHGLRCTVEWPLQNQRRGAALSLWPSTQAGVGVLRILLPASPRTRSRNRLRNSRRHSSWRAGFLGRFLAQRWEALGPSSRLDSGNNPTCDPRRSSLSRELLLPQIRLTGLNQRPQQAVQTAPTERGGRVTLHCRNPPAQSSPEDASGTAQCTAGSRRVPDR
jgi:hypothetical protein